MREVHCDGNRVVFVGNDASLLQPLLPGLHDQGYQVRTAADWLAAVYLVRSWVPNVVLTDFPGNSTRVHGFYAALKAEASPQILALLRDRPGPLRMAALAAGADDYIVAPFTMPELLARLKLAMTRSTERSALPLAKVHTPDLYIDFVQRRIVVSGKEQHLAPKEFALLRCLILDANRVVPHHRLLHAIQTDGEPTSAGKLRVYIRQLRKKLEPTPEHPRYIRTESRIGYRFELGGGNDIVS